MKAILKKIVPVLAVVLFAQSCEKETPKNGEADILTFCIAEEGKTMEIPSSTSAINYRLTKDLALDSLTAVVTISENARISPDPSEVRNFSQPVKFTVTSESGDVHRDYTVTVIACITDSTSDGEGDGGDSTVVAPQIIYNGYFELWDTTGSGNNLYVTPKGWASANSGVTSVHSLGYSSIAYPTFRTTDAYEGNFAVALQTRQGRTSSIGVVPRLIAGNLFLGTMSSPSLQSLSQPLTLTKFGIEYTFNSLPDSLVGYLKYIPGPEYHDENGNTVSGTVDSCAFYAVLFEGPEPLDGTNVQTSSRIVALAKYNGSTPISRSQYTRIALPFVYRRTVTSTANLQYAIIASSSKDGDLYKGAPESILYIDNVNIILKHSKKK